MNGGVFWIPYDGLIEFVWSGFICGTVDSLQRKRKLFVTPINQCLLIERLDA